MKCKARVDCASLHRFKYLLSASAEMQSWRLAAITVLRVVERNFQRAKWLQQKSARGAIEYALHNGAWDGDQGFSIRLSDVGIKNHLAVNGGLQIFSLGKISEGHAILLPVFIAAENFKHAHLIKL